MYSPMYIVLTAQQHKLLNIHTRHTLAYADIK